jgi:hypothetical protein
MKGFCFALGLMGIFSSILVSNWAAMMWAFVYTVGLLNWKD